MSDDQDPPRLADGMAGSAFLRDVLGAAREDRPSQEQMRSLAAGLSAQIGAPIAPPPGGGVGPAPPAAAPASGWVATGTKLGVVLVLTTGVGGVWQLAAGPADTVPVGGQPRAQPRAAAIASARPAGTAAGSGSGSGAGPGSDSGSGSGSGSDSGSGSGSGSGAGADSGLGSAPARRAIGSGVASATPPANPLPPDGELSLLTRAQAALTRDPAASLALVAEHERAWPAGALAQEREVVAVEALVRLGRDGEARRRAAAFASRHPGSPYRRRLDVILARIDAADQKGGMAPSIQR